jgi:hypothetical protein
MHSSHVLPNTESITRGTFNPNNAIENTPLKKRGLHFSVNLIKSSRPNTKKGGHKDDVKKVKKNPQYKWRKR